MASLVNTILWTYSCLYLDRHFVKQRRRLHRAKEGCQTPAVDVVDIEMVFMLFVHRLVGLMLITVVFPRGSWVNNQFDVGGPWATPTHIPKVSPLGAAHGNPGLNLRDHHPQLTEEK